MVLDCDHNAGEARAFHFLLFVDDAKCLHKIKCQFDSLSDLDSLGCWSGGWKLLFIRRQNVNTFT